MRHVIDAVEPAHVVFCRLLRYGCKLDVGLMLDWQNVVVMFLFEEACCVMLCALGVLAGARAAKLLRNACQGFANVFQKSWVRVCVVRVHGLCAMYALVCVLSIVAWQTV